MMAQLNLPLTLISSQSSMAEWKVLTLNTTFSKVSRATRSFKTIYRLSWCSRLTRERLRKTSRRALLKSRMQCQKWLRRLKKLKNCSRINRLQSKLSASNSSNCSRHRTNMNSSNRTSTSSLTCLSCRSYWWREVTWVLRRLCLVQLRALTREWNVHLTSFMTLCWIIHRNCCLPSTKSSMWLQLRKMSKSETTLKKNKTRCDYTSSQISWLGLLSRHSPNADVLLTRTTLTSTTKKCWCQRNSKAETH